MSEDYVDNVIIFATKDKLPENFNVERFLES